MTSIVNQQTDTIQKEFVLPADFTVVKFDEKIEEYKDKVVVVDFFAEWCGPCKMIAPKLTVLANRNDNVIVLKVDVDECGELAEACGIKAMPTFHIYKNGKKVSEVTGANIAKLEDAVAAAAASS